MPAEREDERDLQLSANGAGGSSEQAESNETTRFAATDSDWSAQRLREASNLLMAGGSRQAARLCHEVIQQEPQSIAAYQLLGMAEEENDNLHLALQAYEQVVALHSESSSAKQRIAELRERLADQPQPEAEEERRWKALNRWATVTLVACILVLVGVVVSVFVIRARVARTAQESRQRVFAAQIARGEQLIAAEHYREAFEALRQAEQIKSGAPVTQRLWQQAYEGYQAAAIRDYRSLGGKLSLEPRENPFQPVPVGPEKEGAFASAARSYSGGAWVPQPPYTRVAELPPPLAEGAQDPLGFLADEPLGETIPEPSTTSPLAPEGQWPPRQPAEQITIWREEPSEPGADWSGDLLREQADKLRRQGRYEQAISKYQAAQDEYRQEIQQEPATKAANQAAIRSVEQSISICQEELGS